MLFWDADASAVFTARVLRNDPFLQQIWVEVDESHDLRFVAYDLLRSRATLPAAAAPSEPDEGGELDGDVVPAPPQAKRPRTQPKVPEPELDMATLVHCEEDETVVLTYVPCVNGIAKTGSVAVYGGRDFRVDDLCFEGRRKKAFARLTAISDEVLYTRSCIAEILRRTCHSCMN